MSLEISGHVGCQSCKPPRRFSVCLFHCIVSYVLFFFYVYIPRCRLLSVYLSIFLSSFFYWPFFPSVFISAVDEKLFDGHQKNETTDVAIQDHEKYPAISTSAVIDFPRCKKKKKKKKKKKGRKKTLCKINRRFEIRRTKSGRWIISFLMTHLVNIYIFSSCLSLSLFLCLTDSFFFVSFLFQKLFLVVIGMNKALGGLRVYP